RYAMTHPRLHLVTLFTAFGTMSLCFSQDKTALAQPAVAPVVKLEAAANDANEPFGIDKRIPWMTSKFRGTPEPPLPYRAERVFPKLHLKSPTVLTNAPATSRLFVAEQH